MAIKKIYQTILTGHSEKEDSILRIIANPVEEFSKDIESIIEDLRDTMWAYDFCVGLSAPQIGFTQAISVVNPSKENRTDDLILINPQILSLGGKKDKKRESCMSVWGYIGEVERRDKLHIEYLDENFITRTLHCSGFLSRCIQHEIDHLNGILYCDKLTTNSQLKHTEFFEKYTILE